MNPYLQTQTPAEPSTPLDIEARDIDLLAGWGFDAHEIASLRGNHSELLARCRCCS